MQQNTVQTLITEAKELSGQTNTSNEKAIRGLNRGTDSLSYIKLMVSSKTNPDSSNNTDLSRTVVTTSDTTLSLSGGDLDTGEVLTFRHLEISRGGSYERLTPIDSRDANYAYLQDMTGEPEYFDIEGNILRLLPKPNGSQTYRLSYGRVHPRFTADNLTQSTGLLPVEEEYVMLYLTDYLMIGTNDPSQTGIQNKIAMLEKKIENMEGLRDQSASKRIKPKASTISRNSFKQR